VESGICVLETVVFVLTVVRESGSLHDASQLRLEEMGNGNRVTLNARSWGQSKPIRDGSRGGRMEKEQAY
jgi:hypothetical protein